MDFDFTSVKGYLQRNRRQFEHMQRSALCATNNPGRQVLLATQAVAFASRHTCGLLNAPQLEAALCNIAQQHKVPLAAKVLPNSFLHVLTRAYPTGGHTRIVERWIEASPTSQTHSVVLLSQDRRPVPSLLKEATHTKNGQLHHMSGFPLEKALALRELASSYACIILHTHMYDPVPLLAFGTEDFSTPVLLFNHADHLMWLGASITDMLVNFNDTRKPLSLERRNITRLYHLPLPVAAPGPFPTLKDKEKLKNSLDLSPESKILLTIGREYKYEPFAGLDFLSTVETILNEAPDAILLAIGPSPQHPAWAEASRRTKGRIRALGPIPNHQLGSYLGITDVALESFPLGSPTALLDIARNNIPCVSLATPTNEYDAFNAAGIACSTPQEYSERALSFLKSPPKTTLLYEIIKQEALPEGFGRKLAKLSKNLPVKHHVWSVQPDTGQNLSSVELFNAYNTMQLPVTKKTMLQNMVYRSLWCYTRFLYPFGLSRSIYNRLNSYGLL
ncbi:MAG: hypothetical protein EON60_00200 [Alphaproteobacteria bacterium]|nr:MAG: hypothetical protein EON60_00200 [Alphaproteobacteria bacterium]